MDFNSVVKIGSSLNLAKTHLFVMLKVIAITGRNFVVGTRWIFQIVAVTPN